VVHQDDFLSAQKSLRYHKRSHHIVGNDTTGIPNDVSITVGEAKHLKDVHAAIHAGNDCEVSLRG
jgi:hypothetical protein